jgi:hypothetical protein
LPSLLSLAHKVKLIQFREIGPMARPKKRPIQSVQAAKTLPVPSITLSNFDLLPDSARVRSYVVRGLLANCSEATIERMIRDGRLPPPDYVLGSRFRTFLVGHLRQKLKLGKV